MLDKNEIEEASSIQISLLLKKLSKRQREAIFYFYYENMSYLQISLVMGLKSSKSARNLMYKAFKTIRKAI